MPSAIAPFSKWTGISGLPSRAPARYAVPWQPFCAMKNSGVHLVTQSGADDVPVYRSTIAAHPRKTIENAVGHATALSAMRAL